MDELAENSIAEHSNLFDGTKFYISLRVPDKKQLENVIKAHGGRVVLRESIADILLATDDAPLVNSYSFRWVIECVSAQALVSKERFRLGRRAATAESPASGPAERPKKNTRTPFTSADDELLIRWTRGRASTAGNGIYKDLERECPRHTWQAWRDRFNKRLRDRLPKEHFEPLENAALATLETLAPSRDARAKTPAATVAASPRPTSTSVTKAHRPPPRPAPASSKTTTPTKTSTSAKTTPVAQRATASPLARAVSLRRIPTSASAGYRTTMLSPHTPLQSQPQRQQHPATSPLPRRPHAASLSAFSPAPARIQKITSPLAVAARGSPLQRRQRLVQPLSPNLQRNATTSDRLQVPSPSVRPRRAASPLLSSPDAQQPPPPPQQQQQLEEEEQAPLSLYAKCKALAANEADLEKWLRSCLAQGYSRELASTALFHTTLTPGPLAQVAMDSLSRGRGGIGADVPANYEGIWTAAEDEFLRYFGVTPWDNLSGSDYRQLSRLLLKHGQSGFNMRKDFLVEMDACRR